VLRRSVPLPNQILRVAAVIDEQYFRGFLSSSEGLQAFGDRSFVQAMLQFEASLARAQAAVGLIPESSAQSIVGTCKVDLFDTAKIVRESARAGSLAIPLVKSLKETVGLFNPAAVAHVHFGCTSQDAIDTAMALVTRDALDLIEADVRKAVRRCWNWVLSMH
jgi:3-carboxy-cis,cis-muconate cycloisomerase